MEFTGYNAGHSNFDGADEESTTAVKINGILFDLGGTLFSYSRGKEMGRNIFETARVLGIEAAPREIGRAWRASSESVMRSFASRDYYLHRDLFLDTLDAFAANFGATVTDAIAEDFHARQRDTVVNNLAIRSDCLETLGSLKSRGLYLAIVSNIDDDYLDPLVERNGLDRVLDDWTSSEGARSCKPHGAIYEHALKKGDLDRAETLFVGDSLQHDIAGASSVGMRSARIVEEGVETPLTAGLKITAQPDFEIRALAELVAIVDDAARA